jgi:hypothetical protein
MPYTELMTYFSIFIAIVVTFILCYAGIKAINLEAKKAENTIAQLPLILPYRVKDSLLTPPEMKGFKILRNIVGNRLLLFSKVRLADFMFIPKDTKDEPRFFRRYSQKHVDFLLCHPENSRPICAIEWDDSSHDKPKAQARDEFIEQIYRDAGFPLLRFKTSSTSDEIADALQSYLGSPAKAERVEPLCPKCAVPMVRRYSKKTRSSFWGCVNFPNCHETKGL